MAATNSVLANDTSITLDWADVAGANQYHVQVSERPDFGGTLEVNDNTLVASTHAYVDAGTDNTKRWWRWRSSANAGTTWSQWSEVGSFWINTGASADVTLTTNQWAMFDPDAVTDKYTLVDIPIYSVTPINIDRIQERNRNGDLLSEYVTTKDRITFEYNQDGYATHPQMREFRRFHAEIKTFFLAAYKSNGVDNVPNIWKVEFTEDPGLSMIRGREDLFTGILGMEEV